MILKKLRSGLKIGKEIVPTYVKEESHNMIENIKRQSDVIEMMSQISEVQKKLEWTYEGWKHIGYIDAVLDQPDFFDAKYTKDSNPDKFGKDISLIDFRIIFPLFSTFMRK